MNEYLLCFVVASLLIGCGGSTAGTGMQEGERKLKALTQNDYANLCQESKNTFFDLVDSKQICNLVVVTSAPIEPHSLKDNSSDLYAKCNNQIKFCDTNQVGREWMSFCQIPHFDLLKNCDATVNEFNECIQDTIDSFQSIVAKVSCEIYKEGAGPDPFLDLNYANGVLSGDIVSDSVACNKLKNKCEGLIRSF